MYRVYVIPVDYESTKILVPREDNGTFGLFMVNTAVDFPNSVRIDFMEAFGLLLGYYVRYLSPSDNENGVGLLVAKLDKDDCTEEIAQALHACWVSEQDFDNKTDITGSAVFNAIRSNFIDILFEEARKRAIADEEKAYVSDPRLSMALEQADVQDMEPRLKVINKMSRDREYEFKNPKIYELIDLFKNKGIVFKPTDCVSSGVLPLSDILYFDCCKKGTIDRCLDILQSKWCIDYQHAIKLMDADGLLSCDPVYREGMLICGYQNYIYAKPKHFGVVKREGCDRTELDTLGGREYDTVKSMEEIKFNLETLLLSACFGLGHGAELLCMFKTGVQLLDEFLADSTSFMPEIIGKASVWDVLSKLKIQPVTLEEGLLRYQSGDVIKVTGHKLDEEESSYKRTYALLSLNLERVMLFSGYSKKYYCTSLELPEWLKKACVYGRVDKRFRNYNRDDIDKADLSIRDKIAMIVRFVLSVNGLVYDDWSVFKFTPQYEVLDSNYGTAASNDLGILKAITEFIQKVRNTREPKGTKHTNRAKPYEGVHHLNLG